MTQELQQELDQGGVDFTEMCNAVEELAKKVFMKI